MTYPDILTALARERSGTFLAAAETARRARQARRHRQADRASGTRTAPLRRFLPSPQPGRGPGTVECEAALVSPQGDHGYDQTPQPVSQPC